MLVNQFRKGLLYCLFIFGMSMLVFSPILNSDVCLFSTDNNIGDISRAHRAFPENLLGAWDDATLLGAPNGLAPINVTVALCGMMSPRSCVNWLHGIELLTGAIFLWMFLSKMKIISLPSVVLGGLTAYWVGSNFTLTYSGHIAKFVVVMCAPLALYLVICATRNACRGLWAVLAGGVIALMLTEQQDLALFFGFAIGAFAVFHSMRSGSFSSTRSLSVFLIIGGVAALISGSTLVASYSTNVTGVASVSDENPQSKWEFVTQWSQPPEETIDFIAPGYSGWRSGEPEGPYWGRCGRSAEWEKTKQGFMNFRLDGPYIGAIPVIFALFALVAALCAKKRAENAGEFWQGWGDRRAEILFWSAVAIITLVLGYGKFTPLYWFFYQLPVVNNIRAPVKFLQVFQVAVAVLAVYGLDFALQWMKSRPMVVGK
jgi:hypothetical protein